MEGDPLATGPEEMRRMAHATVDLLVELLSDPRAQPALLRAGPDEMERRLPSGPPPASGRPFEELLAELRDHVLPFMGRPSHPRFFAFIPGAGTFPGALGDFIASALNIFAGNWMESAGPSRLELVVLDWFKAWVGYPAHAAGSLVTGGSAANLTALACAREARAGAMRDDLVIYVSDQAHSSIARAARTLGFRPEQLRVLPSDASHRMRPDAVAGAIAADRAAGRTPLIVCASAGSTNTGAVDPLASLADLCASEEVWLHVDAAYGGFAVLTERGRAVLSGMERADSITLDPHKWLYQPFECGSLLVREGHLLREAFEMTPDYLKDVQVALREVNFSDLGLQLTRTTRALKVWLSLSAFGVDAFRAVIDGCLDLAESAQERIAASPELELMHEAALGIVCFRRALPGAAEAEVEELNRRLVAELAGSGEGLVSSTRLRGRYAVRLCVLNHASTRADVEHVLRFFEAGEARAPAFEGPPGAAAGRDTGVEDAWSAGSPEGSRLASFALFDGVPAPALEVAAAGARTIAADTGEAVTTRWAHGRDFYVVLEGRVGVGSGDGGPAAELGPGEFFGELAALDWGAGYGYARLATVTALEPVRLLALTPEVLSGLMAASGPFAARIRAAAAERLARL